MEREARRSNREEREYIEYLMHYYFDVNEDDTERAKELKKRIEARLKYPQKKVLLIFLEQGLKNGAEYLNIPQEALNTSISEIKRKLKYR